MGKTSWRFSYLFGAYSAIFECIECEGWQVPRKPRRGSYTSAHDVTIARASTRRRGVRRLYTASAGIAHTKVEAIALRARRYPSTRLACGDAAARADARACEVRELHAEMTPECRGDTNDKRRQRRLVSVVGEEGNA